MPAEARKNDNEGKLTSKQDSLVRKNDLIKQHSWSTKASSLFAQVNRPDSDSSSQIAEGSWSNEAQGEQAESAEIIQQLQEVSQRNFSPFRGAPGFTFANPSGFGADRGSKYIGIGFTPNSRNAGADLDNADAILGFGVGLGNAHKSVGLELNYTIAGLGIGSDRDFGTGGFNAKLHRVISRGWGVAAGYNGFLNIGDDNDFEDSLYLATTKIFSTREKLNSAFSRVAITAGVGNGQFRTEDAIFDDDEGFNPFGSVAVRVARPISGVIEWTGQDLAVGTSVAPFRKLPITVNLGLRDIVGAGDGARFVVGVGAGF